MTTEQPAQKIHWEKWTALGSVMMALCALLTSLWQGYALQQHNRLSVRPLFQFEANFDKSADGQISFELLVNNNGLGPARIEAMRIWFEEQPLSSAHQIWPLLKSKAAAHCLGSGSVQGFYKVGDQQMLLRTLADCHLSETEYQRLAAALRVELVYESLYGDSFSVRWGNWPE